MWITKRNLRQTDYSGIIMLDHNGLFSFHGANQGPLGETITDLWNSNNFQSEIK